MLELDDIQHFLLTRPPALAARYEFLSLPGRVVGPRAGWPACSTTSGTRRRRAAHADARQPLGHVAFTWNGLARARRRRGVAGDVSGRVPPRHGGARRVLGDTGAEPSGPLGGRPGRRRISTPSSSCSPATSPNASAASANYQAFRGGVSRRRGCLHAGSRGDAAVRPCPRPLRLPRSPVAAGDRRHRRRADARLGRAAEGGRVLPRLSRRGRRTARCPSPRSCPATAAISPTGACRNTSAGSAISCASTARRPRSRNCSRRS